jgi:hypothetical protein
MNYHKKFFSRMMTALAVLSAIIGFSVVYAQKPATAPAAAVETGSVVMKATVGSFKILSPNDQNPAFGKINMTFRGSLLVTSSKDTKVTVTGNLRKEYENAKYGKAVYFGQGNVIIEGKFKSIQWFGKDLNLAWTGVGVCRMYGEFDAKGETGTYTVAGDVLRYWGTGGAMFTLPRYKLPGEAAKTPKVKIGN